jgi:hypothetical protein
MARLSTLLAAAGAAVVSAAPIRITCVGDRCVAPLIGLGEAAEQHDSRVAPHCNLVATAGVVGGCGLWRAPHAQLETCCYAWCTHL